MKYFKRAECNVTIQEQDEEAVNKQRGDSHRSRSTAAARSAHRKPPLQNTEITRARTSDNPLQEREACNDWKPFALKSTQQLAQQQQQQQPAQQQHFAQQQHPTPKGYTMSPDPQISTLLARVDVIEGHASKIGGQNE